MAAPLHYRQRPGVDTRIVDGEAFLITASNILHLNPVATAVWLLLEEPARCRDAVNLLAELYPQIRRADVQRDVQHILRNLLKAELVEGSKTPG